MASIKIEITGQTGPAVQSLNEVSQATEQVGESQKKVAKTEEEKWAEAAERNKRKKAWLEEQKKLEEEANKAAGKSASTLGKVWAGMDEKMKGVAKSWTDLNSKISVVTGAVGAAVGFISGVYDKLKEFSGEYEKITNQMTILSSQKGSGEIILQLERMEEATNGVVGKFDLLESVNKATSFGIDLTGGRLEKLVGVASKAAATMGTDLKFAFESLIVGTARESMMILDNLGVMVDITKANEDYAKSIGKTKEELTDVESKTALLNQVLDRLGRTQKNIVDEELLSSATGLFATFERGWKSVKLGLGGMASDFIQWVDDLGRSETQIEKRKYKEMLGDIRDFYERKRALAVKELDDETQKYLDKHQLMSAEEKADYILSQNKKKRRLGELNDIQRMDDLKSSSLNRRIADELVKLNQVNSLWLDTEQWKQQILDEENTRIGSIRQEWMRSENEKREQAGQTALTEQELQDEWVKTEEWKNHLIKENKINEDTVNASRLLSNQGIHKMFIEQIKKGFNESEQAMIDYYFRSGLLIDEDFYKFKGRIVDGTVFALKTLDKFAQEASAAAVSGKWGEASIMTIFGISKAELDKLQDTKNGLKDIWKNIFKNKEDANNNAKKAEDEREKQREKHLDNLIKLEKEKLKKDADLFNKKRQQDLDNMISLYKIERTETKKQSLQNLYDAADEGSEKLKYLSQMSTKQYNEVRNREQYLDDLKAEMASKYFDDKWKKMIEFENKYNTDLGLSGEDVNKLTKEQLDERLSVEEQYYEVKNKMQEMSVRAAADFTSMLINDVLLGEKEFRKEMIGDFVKGIGTQMVADGTFHIFSGIAKGWAGNPAGWAESKAGAVEVGVGVGLGATAKAIGTSGGSESKSKETASADRINNNTNGRDQMQVYLYPSQKYYLRTHNNANKKLGYKK